MPQHQKYLLAREAELCYATMAHITDYDVWHETVEPVTIEMVVKTYLNNTVVGTEIHHQFG